MHASSANQCSLDNERHLSSLLSWPVISALDSEPTYWVDCVPACRTLQWALHVSRNKHVRDLGAQTHRYRLSTAERFWIARLTAMNELMLASCTGLYNCASSVQSSRSVESFALGVQHPLYPSPEAPGEAVLGEKPLGIKELLGAAFCGAPSPGRPRFAWWDGPATPVLPWQGLPRDDRIH